MDNLKKYGPIVIVMLIALYCIDQCGKTEVSRNMSNEYVEPSQILYADAAEIYAAYESNEIAADAKYLNKNTCVTGIVYQVGKDINNAPYVELSASDNEYLNVRCYLKNDQTNYAANIRKGQRVSLLGLGNGFPIHSVQLRDCVFR